MNKLFSVRLLFHSTHIPDTTGSFYEESIVLIRGINEEDVNNKALKYYKPWIYDNADNGTTTVTLVRVLDVFEIIDEINDPSVDFKEVYSEFLIFNKEILSTEDIISKYNNLYGFNN